MPETTSRISDGSGMYPKMDFRVYTSNQPKNGFKASFSFAKSLAYLMNFSKFCRAFVKSSNMPKIWQKMRKSLVQLAFNPVLHGTTVKTLNPGFSYLPVTRSVTSFKEDGVD